MFRFFESIAVLNGVPRNLFYHQSRIDRTFSHFYPKIESHHLEYLLSEIKFIEAPSIKCKFTYSDQHFKFSQLPYLQKNFKSFILIQQNTLEYDYKFLDRSKLDKISKTYYPEIQILFCKDHFLTDSSFSNLIFYDGYRWLTPSNPLLKGTMRESLLADWKIHEAEIHTDHLRYYKSFKLINALNSLDEAYEYPIELIKPDIIKI